MKANTRHLIALLLSSPFLVPAGAAVAADAAMPGMNHAEHDAEARTVTGHGVVQSIDATAGTVTLAHDAIPELNWPAMTMPFKVSGDAAAKVEAGQKVSFELQGEGMQMTIVKIEVAD